MDSSTSTITTNKKQLKQQLKTEPKTIKHSNFTDGRMGVWLAPGSFSYKKIAYFFKTIQFMSQ